MRRRRTRLIVGLALALGACAPAAPRNTGVYLLLDTSGTYSERAAERPRRSSCTRCRDWSRPTRSRSRASTPAASARRTSSRRPPSTTVRAPRTRRSARSPARCDSSSSIPSRRSTPTSRGGLLQAIEFLNEKHSGRKTILIFSDLKEDLAKGYVRDVPLDLKGFEVVALNVTKLRTDNFDPHEYLSRVDTWKAKVEQGGGRWRMINDLERLDGLL